MIYLQVKNGLTLEPIINLKVESEFSPIFTQCEVVNKIVIVGYGDRFYMFDLDKKKIKKNILIDGYFSSFLVADDEIFVATNYHVINISFDGKEKWVSDSLGIDGIVLSRITQTELFGSGEWDPPGGWENFILNRKTGKKR